MKLFLAILTVIFLSVTSSFAQSGREVHGTVIDTTKQAIPSGTITLTSDKHDSISTISDLNGKFTFSGIKGTKIVLSVSSIGYQGIKRHYTLANDNTPADLGTIVLKVQSNMLNQVNIVGVIPVTLKEDTVQYQASAYKVRENAPAEDLIKKLPGVDVDVNGNITTQGKTVTKVRINGKDFMGGDVQSATKNLPADVIENIQMIDDYGDQANLTGIKTGEPAKIMNITIRKDKNYGYFGQATVGDGEDALPQSQGIPNDNRYIGSLNVFDFKGDQQISVLGSINNSNVNTFSFGSNGGGGGGGFGGGGGQGNAARGGGGNNGSLITTQNGLTEAHYIGGNFRDQWGKALSVYGSYSFADNTVNTINNINQQNFSAQNPSSQLQNSNETDQNINHRFTWNMEYKPDTVNYLKVTPTYAYAGTTTADNESVLISRPKAKLGDSTAYNELTNAYSHAPNYGFTALYNRRLNHRNNLSINFSFSSAPSTSYANPVYDYKYGTPTAPLNQQVTTYSRTDSYGINLSYLFPIGKLSYLEFNYAFNTAITNNNKQTDIYEAASNSFITDSALSNVYKYTFTTNKAGLNYRFIEKKYNYTLGVGFQPAVLDGSSPTTGDTHISTFNIIPAARYTYNFSRSRNFSVNYNGSSSTPSFSQLQPVTDFSNALYPVQGNPNLKPQFTNNFSIRYNNFSFATGDIFFARLQYTSISDYVATNTITFPSVYKPDPRFQNAILTDYVNASGYNTTSGQVTYAKPWDNRKFTVQLRGTVSYTNNIGYLTNVTDSLKYNPTTVENISKNLQFTPQVQFRVDITDIIDAQLLTNYAINRTSNSVNNSLTSGTSDIRTWNSGLTGKNYFGDWTFSYDLSHATNYGYASTIKVTNPNIVNLYVERRFLKDHRATVRISAFDLFNENTGFSSTQTASSLTETHVNRLARYYLATFTLRLQKFAGKAPTQDPGMRGFRRGGGGAGPGGPGGGPGNGPE